MLWEAECLCLVVLATQVQEPRPNEPAKPLLTKANSTDVIVTVVSEDRRLLFVPDTTVCLPPNTW